GAVATLTFTQQPTGTVAGVAISPLITVRALDSFGNNVSGASIAMTLTAGTGTLSGTTPQTTNAGGIAAFTDLSIDSGGSKNLTASSGAATPIESNAFYVDTAPTNAADWYVALKNGTLVVGAPGVLANDSDVDA